MGGKGRAAANKITSIGGHENWAAKLHKKLPFQSNIDTARIPKSDNFISHHLAQKWREDKKGREEITFLCCFLSRRKKTSAPRANDLARPEFFPNLRTSGHNCEACFFPHWQTEFLSPPLRVQTHWSASKNGRLFRRSVGASYLFSLKRGPIKGLMDITPTSLSKLLNGEE